MKKDPNYVVKLEKAIAEKYGKETIQNPKRNWDEEKEKKYQNQLKKILEKRDKKQHKGEKIEVEGFFAYEKLLNREEKRECPVCGIYSFKIKDSVYLNKFDCCFECYIQWVENREERWKNGWRPDEVDKERLKDNN